MADTNKFNSFQAILLGAQAAGISASIYSEIQGNRIRGRGAELEQRELGLRMQQEELAFTQANIENLQNLRETLATQNAILGARGQASGQGSALAVQNKSIANFNADTEAMRLNKTFRQSQYKALEKLQGIKLASSRQESSNRILGQGLNMFSISESLYKKRGDKTKTSKPTDFISKSSGNK